MTWLRAKVTQLYAKIVDLRLMLDTRTAWVIKCAVLQNGFSTQREQSETEGARRLVTLCLTVFFQGLQLVADAAWNGRPTAD